MSRAFNADASLCIPRMIPWRDWDEWYRVKAFLFSPEPYLRFLGVQHVAAWRSRERVPHAVETTSQLVEVRLNDAGQAGGGVASPCRSEEELRLVYSALIIRAVNGLTGHEQKMAHALPVSSLARGIGLPTWLVDIRHEAAHKQLPGIVTLRLASDFLVDYLWRRYWGPQAEHLGFVRSAFDQLISRFKATSDGDASLACNTLSSKKRRANSSPSPHLGAHATSAAAGGGGGGGAAVAGAAAASAASTAPRAGSGPPPAPPTPSRALLSLSSSTRAGVGAGGATVASAAAAAAAAAAASAAALAAAREAAQAIALSVTPTALSWALVSLLAGGGGGGTHEVGGGGGGGGVGGGNATRKRGQGHLLPRSRDKYPTPGTPGVDEDEVSRRITGRWAPLLDIFHSKWRGFGATLLVRLVEALLDNASPSQVGLGAVAGPTGCSSLGGGDGGGVRGGGGGEGKGGEGGGCFGRGGAGLERQAAFIGLWVRYLLSRRWHLRAGAEQVQAVMRKAAIGSGLSPTFWEEDEEGWTQEEHAWADKAAPLSALQAACFPLRELSDRCRRSTAALLPEARRRRPSPSSGEEAAGLGPHVNSVKSVSTFHAPLPAAAADADADGADGVADAADADEGDGSVADAADVDERDDRDGHADDDVDDRRPARGRTHWAKPGLDTVCRALEEALADVGGAPGAHIGGSSSSSSSSRSSSRSDINSTSGDDDHHHHHGAAAPSPSGRRGQQTSIPKRKLPPGPVTGLVSSPRAPAHATAHAPASAAAPTAMRGDNPRSSSAGALDHTMGGDSGGDLAGDKATVSETAGGAPAGVVSGTSEDEGGGPIATIATMMDLDSLELLLDGDRSSGGCMVPPGGSTGVAVEATVPEAAAAAAAEDPSAACAAGEGGGGGGFEATQRGAEVGGGWGGGGGGEGEDAWELVEEWTACPIGTLPGWSSAPLWVDSRS